MDFKDKNLSLKCYTYLCNIVGSEEVVKTRREIFAAMDIVRNTTGDTLISSGSKAEGIDLKGSDFDEMSCLNCVHVFESSHDVQFDPNTVLLVMETNDTKPGFTKLKLVNKYVLVVVADWFETVGEKSYISSKRFRESSLRDGLVFHGPCHSTANGDYDCARCLRCYEWISPAHQWIHRSRTTWPNYTLVTSAVQYGVLFVPIGCKSSPNEDLQWRISFSVTEKLLIHSFSHTQLLCYALMKIILKDLIKPRHGDLLCSYFLKTIMFWLSEERNPSEWKPDNMISCFLDCIRRLIYCVEYKTCLHYFIPEYNLFEDRFTGNDHKSLLNTLRFIYESPLISIFATSTFQNYRLQSVNLGGMVLSASELSSYSYVHGYCPHVGTKAKLNYSQIKHVNSEFNYSAIKHIINVCSNKELCTYMLSLEARNYLQSSHHCNMMARNKLFYQQYKKTLCYFKITLLLESMSPWLLLASLFYKCKRFLECLDIINYCLCSCSPKKFLLHPANSLAEQNVFNEMKQKWGLLNAFKHLVIDHVGFRYPCCLLPDELIPSIEQINERTLILSSPDEYSNILKKLCWYHLEHRTRLNFELTKSE